MSCFEIASLIISGFVAIGTISLAIFAYKQIKRAREDIGIRQLTDIQQWASNLINWEYSTAAREPVSMRPDILYKNYASVLKSEKRLLSIILRNGTWISSIAPVFKNETLNKTIKELLEEISKTIQVLESYIDSITPHPRFMSRGFEPPEPSKLREQKMKQDKLAKNLINAVSEIIQNYY